jgi:hypothetical protein
LAPAQRGFSYSQAIAPIVLLPCSGLVQYMFCDALYLRRRSFTGGLTSASKAGGQGGKVTANARERVLPCSIKPGNEAPRAIAVGIVFVAELRTQQPFLRAYAREEGWNSEYCEQNADK